MSNIWKITVGASLLMPIWANLFGMLFYDFPNFKSNLNSSENPSFPRNDDEEEDGNPRIVNNVDGIIDGIIDSSDVRNNS